jgi:hypothetical protein
VTWGNVRRRGYASTHIHTACRPRVVASASMSDWSYFTSVPIQIGQTYYGSTMPMNCPGCGLEWSDTGLGLPIRDNVNRSWGSAPTLNSVASVFYECAACGHQAYDDRRGEYRR